MEPLDIQIKFFENDIGGVEMQSCEVVIAGYGGVYYTENPHTYYPWYFELYEYLGEILLELYYILT